MQALRSPIFSAALAAAVDLVAIGPDDPLAASTALRAQGYPADLTASALTQATLRRKAAAKFGPDAASMFFTRTGLEQATRGVVAGRRAARLAAAGVRRIADLGCGIGADTIAFARAGLSVLSVEADTATAEVASANVAALGLDDRVEVRVGDATTVELDGVDAVFCDPARRATAGRVFDPAAYSPPWSFVAKLPDHVAATVLKLAPGIDHALVPAGAEAEWVSVDGDVVEAAFWCGPLAAVPRRATVLRGGVVHTLTGTGDELGGVGEVGAYVYDPDGAVVRSHLVAEFAASVGGHLADPHIAYVFAHAPTPSPFGRCFEVIRTLPAGQKHLRAALRDEGIGRLEIRKRGLAVDPDALRRSLHLAGDAEATLVLTRLGQRPIALLCRSARSG